MRNILFGSAMALLFALPAFAQTADEAAPVAEMPQIQPQPSDTVPAGEGMVAAPETSGAAAPASVPVQPAANGDVVAALPPPGASQTALSAMETEINERLSYLRPNVDLSTMPSLFFSVWEHDLISDARRGLTTRAPGIDDGVTGIAGPRDIALGGIVYAGSKDWTIWINNIRVSPTAIPEEVMDLKVYKEYIELEWFDSATNQIFPIRLRAHQRFNLDTRMFLPG